MLLSGAHIAERTPVTIAKPQTVVISGLRQSGTRKGLGKLTTESSSFITSQVTSLTIKQLTLHASGASGISYSVITAEKGTVALQSVAVINVQTTHSVLALGEDATETQEVASAIDWDTVKSGDIVPHITSSYEHCG